MGRSAKDMVRIAAALPAAAALLALLCGLAPAAARADQAAGVHEADPDGVRSYWTPERMDAAIPLLPAAPAGNGGPASPASQGDPALVDPVAAGSGEISPLVAGTTAAGADSSSASLDRDEVANPSAEPFRSHGKVFLTISGGPSSGDYVCSGTAIASNNKSVVWTAGHCVFDTDGGGYASNWMFVPAYSSDDPVDVGAGSTPFGKWPATELATTKPWRTQGNLSYDLGAAVVDGNAQGESLTDLVGGRGIAFNQARDKVYRSFGYPAEQPPAEFSGGREFRCTSELGGTDNPPGSGPNTDWIPCDMTGGSSGGGWVAGGQVLSVNSYSYCLLLVCEQNLYGPYQEDKAEKLYSSVAGEAHFCAGEQVTVLGTSGPDELVGTANRDVFQGRGGADVIKGKGGNDIACGGGGRDVLKGKGGKDLLKGNKRSDELRGGNGKDRCDGGPGKDHARGCEVRHSI